MSFNLLLRFMLVLMAACLQAAVAHAEPAGASPNTVVTLTDQSGTYPLGRHLMILEDASEQLTLDDLRHPDKSFPWQQSVKDVPSYGFTPSAYWVVVDISRENTREAQWLLEFGYAPMQSIDVYAIHEDGRVVHQHGGAAMPYHQRPYAHHKHVFELSLPAGQTTRLFVRVDGESSKNLPLRLYRADVFAQASSHELAMLCIYAGIALGLACYNAFIFATLKEAAYLFYVCFLGASIMLIMSVNGISQITLFPDSPMTGAKLVPLSVGLLEVFGFMFAAQFLQTRDALPGLHRVLIGFTSVSLLICLLPWLANYRFSTIAATFVGLLGAITLITSGVAATIRGYKPARYFLLAWLMLLFGIVLFVLRAYGILPSNLFTEYTMLWGSAAEAILLSVALAARMRIMKEEKERAQATQLATQQALVSSQAETLSAQQALVNSQAETLSAQQESLKNKQIALETVQKYSVKLEAEVKVRTAELVETQQKLVASEKMAALGVFTAGMAHEINNPANFISVGAQNAAAQIHEFRGFVKDLLAEDADAEITEAFESRFAKLEKSTQTVSEGVTRIEHVVKQLRADHPEGEAGMQPADVVESLESAWRVLSPTIKIPVSTAMQFEARPPVPCRIAEIHQVFMALLVNAVHAIEDAAATHDPAFRGEIRLASKETAGTLVITVSDNGCGIPADKIDKIFDPFFTTKAVGRGAGLGLSMARDVVKMHAGALDVESSVGRGSTFTLALPLAGL